MLWNKYPLVALCLFSSFAWGQISKSNMDAAIDKKQLRHPYLIFSDADKAEMLKRIETDRECRDIMRMLLAETNRLLHQPVNFNAPTQGKNTRADWTEADRDGKYEEYYDSNMHNAVTLAYVYQMTGDQKYADKAFEFADAFCDLPTWTMRPHEFPIIYSRIMPWNVPDDQVCFSFDHNNGEAGRYMGYVYDWLYPALNQRQRDRIRGALIEKVITLVRGDYEFHWWATSYRCNWCGVCNSGVGIAGLALLTENPQLTDVVAESYNHIYKMLNELGVDGGWQEGCGYWSYALRTSLQFGIALKRLTNGKYNLFENPRLKANPVTFPLYMSVPPYRSVNFEDSGSFRIGPNYLFNLLATEYNDPGAIWYRHNLLGEGRDLFEIIWPRPKQTAPEPEKKSLHFRSIDFWVMRDGFTDPSQVLVAGKAGMNDDPHHGHLDIGQVVVFWQGQAFIGEVDRRFYDEKYFDDARWDYPNASSVGHNLIFVNGEKQIPGKMFKQPYNYEIGGKVLEFRTSAERDYALMDPTNAYPKKELRGWRRHVILQKPDITVILDEVKSNQGAEIEARFHSECTVESNDRFVLLKGGDRERQQPAGRRRGGYESAAQTPMRTDGIMALIPVVASGFTVREDRHANLTVNATREFEWIPYFGVVTNAAAEKTVIGTVILPVKDKEEAGQIAESLKLSQDQKGSVELSFVRGDQTVKFRYDSTPNGLVLEK